MGNTEHAPIHVCPTHGIVLVRGSVEGPWCECLTCGLRTAVFVPVEQLHGAVEAVRKAHEWLERVEQTPGGYFGLDHKLGENVEGCTFCAAAGEQ